jgi:hypothetical protein
MKELDKNKILESINSPYCIENVKNKFDEIINL